MKGWLFMKRNIHHQPIGESVTDFEPLNFPDIKQLDGRYSSLVKLSETHINDLFDVLCNEDNDAGGLICLANQSMITVFFRVY